MQLGASFGFVFQLTAEEDRIRFATCSTTVGDLPGMYGVSSPTCDICAQGSIVRDIRYRSKFRRITSNASIISMRSRDVHAIGSAGNSRASSTSPPSRILSTARFTSPRVFVGQLVRVIGAHVVGLLMNSSFLWTSMMMSSSVHVHDVL